AAGVIDLTPKSAAASRPSRPHQEGRIAIVTDVGYGMQRTRQRRKTGGAVLTYAKGFDGPCPPKLLAKADARTAKSCGPDAPTLASRSREVFRERRWQKSPVTEEHEGNR